MATRTFFTLEYQSTPGQPGTEKSLADWGLAAQSCQFVSLSPSKFIFRQIVQDPSISPLFPFEGWVVLRFNRARGGSLGAYTYSGGTTVFQGYRTYCSISSDANTASISYTFEDPWWALNIKTYKQPYAMLAGENPQGQPIITTTYTSEVSLFQQARDPNNPNVISKWTTGQQIMDAANYARARGVYIQIGTIDPANQVAISQVRDRTCAEVIELSLKTHPDAVAWFDHSVFPPKLNVRLRANLASVSMPYGKSSTSPYMLSCNFRDRPDLQLTYVSLFYKVMNSITGGAGNYITWTHDLYPPNTTDFVMGGIDCTFDMAGFQASVLTGYLTAVPLPADIFSVTIPPSQTDPTNVDRMALWCWKHPQIRLSLDGSGNPLANTDPNQRIQNLIIGPAWVEDDKGNDITATVLAMFGNAPSILEGKGTISSWMTLPGGAPVVGYRATLKMSCGYVEQAIGGVGHAVTYDPPLANDYKGGRGKLVAVEVTFTNAVTGKYQAVASTESADPIPLGLAQAYWTALQPLQYDGTYVFRERAASGSPDCSFPILVGNVLNLSNPSGGPFNAAWASMNAMVQSVECDLERGITTVSVSPGKHATLQDFITLFELSRWRVLWHNPLARNTAQDSGNSGGGVADGYSPMANTVAAAGLPSAMELFTKTGVPSGNPNPGVSIVAGNILGQAPELAGTSTPQVQPVLAVQRRICCDANTGASLAAVTLATEPFAPS